MSADDLYGLALALLGETRDKAKGYADKLVPLTNLLLAAAAPAEGALRRARGLPPLDGVPAVATAGEALPCQPDLQAGCLPYGLAGMLILDDDPGRANYLNALFDGALARLCPADWVPVADCYGEAAG